MPRWYKNLFSLVLICALLGCTLPGQPVGGTAPAQANSGAGASSTAPGGPSPTLTTPPQVPSATVQVTTSPTPLTEVPTSPALPSVTPTAVLDTSNMLLRIAAPGPMSKVISPIDFAVYIAPGYTGLTRIQLLGEDGRQLYSKAFRTYSNVGSPTRVVEQINFEIHGAAEVGRLQVSTVDQYGRMQAFNSVRLLLLSVGENELTPPYPPVERVALSMPKPDQEIAGALLNVAGEIQPLNDSPVVLELYDTGGNLIGSRILTLHHADGTYQPFTTVIPYKIDQKTIGRLMIHQADDRIDGLAYLYSVSLVIDP